MRPIRSAVRASLLMWLAALTAAGAREAAPSPPRLLSETGLYVRGGGTTRIDPRNRRFAPQYPLWSDGAEKSRWVFLPRGGTIDGSDLDEWHFPIGTRFWKEFEFAGRKVETRLLWKSGDRAWTFASYVWNDAQTDAVLAPPEGVPAIAEIAPGRWHSIPSTADCRACHDSARTEVLGFTALQLSPDRDPLALHAEPVGPDLVNLETLVREATLAGAPADLLSNPPRIRAGNPETRAVLGYLSANCGNCHNLKGSLAHLGLDLLQKARGPVWTDGDAARLLGRPTSWQQPGTSPGGSVAVTPGVPESSALLYRLRSRRPSSQMPPLGTILPDAEAVDLVTRWVRDSLRHAH